MNTTFNNTSQADFNTAVKMCRDEHDYEALIGFIETGSIVEKQIAVLELMEIKSAKDAKILVSNLINQDGKIREVVALKVNELIKNPAYSEYFYDMENYGIFLNGIIDVNSNNCRQIIDVSCFLDKNEEFSDYLVAELPKRIHSLFEKLEKFKYNDKKHVINKTIFKLYWYLETLYHFAEKMDFAILKEILFKSGSFHDYTIREKTAKLFAKGLFDKDADLSGLKNKLKNDENYYVRRYLS